jgi:ActR/RegA family two-component response regulator
MADDDRELPADGIGKSPLAEEANWADQYVLIVDDDEDFAASLCSLLKLDGYNPCVAHDRAAALAQLALRRVAVALIDVRLGTGSGVDLIREVHLQNPDLVCVMVTAYASIDTAIEALQAGAYDYMCKPFHSEDLLATGHHAAL